MNLPTTDTVTVTTEEPCSPEDYIFISQLLALSAQKEKTQIAYQARSKSRWDTATQNRMLAQLAPLTL